MVLQRTERKEEEIIRGWCGFGWKDILVFALISPTKCTKFPW